MSAGVQVNGLTATKQWIADLKGQIPYATSVALNKTGKEVIGAQKDEMRRVFDAPTPYTLASLFKTTATKANLETRTRIKKTTGDKEGQTDKHYVGVQIWGGQRKDKGSEKRLRARGLLPHGYQMVPGAGLKLNQYGNVSGPRVSAILRALGVNDRSYTIAAGTFVVGQVGGTRGIWKVQKNKWVPIFIFVKMPNYSALFDYYAVSETVFAKRWKSIFGEAIDSALRTAK